MAALTFTIAAPTAAFGELAGTHRSVRRTPSFSAVVGLLGAALGIPRKDDSLLHIAKEYAMAVRIEKEGRDMLDYHTVETPHSKSGARFHTRRDELAGKTGTVVTRREYRQDVEYTIALFPIDEQLKFTLEDLSSALNNPRYTLYAGRRSCPLSQPPDPKIIDGNTVSEVLGLNNLVFDSRLDPGDCQPHHAIERRDMPIGERHFQERTEYIV